MFLLLHRLSLSLGDPEQVYINFQFLNNSQQIHKSKSPAVQILVFQMILAFPYVVTAALHHTNPPLNKMLMSRQQLSTLYFVFQSITPVSDSPVLLEQQR